MTWTLRFYDDSDREIAWVQVASDGTYSYEITHPEEGWRDFDVMLDDYRRVYAEMDGSLDVSGYPFSLRQDPARIEKTLTPEEHLSLIRDDLAGYPEVGSVSLADE